MHFPRLVGALVAVLVLAACDGPDADASGEEIYMQICARCHAPDLRGSVGPALGDGSNAAAQTDRYLIDTVTEGRGRMPSFRQTLSTAQIERVVQYLREQQGHS